MTEEIGKVKLDYGKYSGEDYYSDGSVEDELLEIVRKVQPADYGRVIEERRSWPVLYHLSPLRENIVDWLPIGASHRVLEVGSGCGAITGALSRKAGSVTCVDLSKKRSLINAYRHSGCENITIHVGNFKDIEPDLPADYDFICLIGVFEYGRAYIGGDRPYEEFLKIIKRHLKPGGRIIIAIENRYGLKYFAGCSEDHLGTYFSGIENYSDSDVVRTFGRAGLEKIFNACEITEYSFYYPYPDYKFMTTLYSDSRLPAKGELSDNLRNFDRDRMLLFDERSAFDGITEEGLFPVFSNSYLAVIGEPFETEYVKYSNDRAAQFGIRTVICRDKKGGHKVKKYPLAQEAQEHVREMQFACESLKKKYEGGFLNVADCSLSEEDGVVCAEFEYVHGRPLSELFDECLERGDSEGFLKLFREYMRRIDYNGDFPASDYDLIFSNILADGDIWTLIDYEWTFGKPIASREIAFRAVCCYMMERSGRSVPEADIIFEELGITPEEAEKYREREREFQQFVTENRLAMGQIRDLIGCRVMTPLKWLGRHRDSEQVERVQIYEDRGRGFNEEESYFARDAYQGEDLIELDIKTDAQVRAVRIDPSFDCCVVRIRELTFNGERIPVNRKTFSSNGKIFNKGESRGGDGVISIVFPTEDPNISLCLERLERHDENRLHVNMEIIRLSSEIAGDIAGTADDKRRFGRR